LIQVSFVQCVGFHNTITSFDFELFSLKQKLIAAAAAAAGASAAAIPG
jgi:hypothetical protein